MGNMMNCAPKFITSLDQIEFTKRLKFKNTLQNSTFVKVCATSLANEKSTILAFREKLVKMFWVWSFTWKIQIPLVPSLLTCKSCKRELCSICLIFNNLESLLQSKGRFAPSKSKEYQRKNDTIGCIFALNMCAERNQPCSFTSIALSETPLTILYQKATRNLRTVE